MSKIKLNQIEVLVAAVDSGSFSAAAVELGCTQSRISHSIVELEDCVGARLLVRSRSGCTPTHAGHQILAKARHLLKIADGMQRMITDVAQVSGTVRVACIRSASTHLLPVAVEALAEEYPGIYVEIHDGCDDYADVTALVQQGIADIGITRGPTGENLVSRRLVSDPYVVIAPASVPLSSPVRWDELAMLPFIHIQQPGAMWIVEQCRAAGFTQQPGRRLASETGILAMVGRGLGYTMLPRLATFPDAASTKVLELPFMATRHLEVFTHRSIERTQLVKTVMQYILDKRLIMKTTAWQAGILRVDH